MNRDTLDMLTRLHDLGISTDDAISLRRIAMTLHRWHELECGDSNDYASWGIVRGSYKPEGFTYDEDGKPFKEVHPHSGKHTRYYAMHDRERGALKRMAAIMARYPGFTSYVQGDPRGCALYIVPKTGLFSTNPSREYLEANYSRGIAVYK